MKIRWDGPFTSPAPYGISVSWTVPAESIDPSFIAMLTGTSIRRVVWMNRWWRIPRPVERAAWDLLHRIGRA